MKKESNIGWWLTRDKGVGRCLHYTLWWGLQPRESGYGYFFGGCVLNQTMRFSLRVARRLGFPLLKPGQCIRLIDPVVARRV